MKVAGVVEFPWMLADRGARQARLLAFYEGRGDRNAVPNSWRYADDPLANLCGDCEPILELLRGGEDVEGVSRLWGISSRTLYRHLLVYAAEEFRALSALRALSRKREAEERLEGASDNVGVSKWRSLLQASQWDLERLLPKLYGVKQEASGLQITVNLDRSCGGVVELSGGGVSQRLVIDGAEASGSDGGESKRMGPARLGA